LAWVWYASHRDIPAKAPQPAPTKRAAAPRSSAAVGKPTTPSPSGTLANRPLANPGAPTISARGSAPAPTPPVRNVPAKTPESHPPVANVRGASKPPITTATPNKSQPRPTVVSPHVGVPAAKPPVVTASPKQSRPNPPPPSPGTTSAAAPTTRSTTALNAPRARADKAEARKVARAVEPLKDPVPRVTAILISS